MTGDNGILTRAQKAKELTNIASTEEKIKVEVLGGYNLIGQLDVEKVISNIEENIAEATIQGEEFPLKVTLDGNEFIVNENGTVIESGANFVKNPYDRYGWTYACVCVGGNWIDDMIKREDIDSIMDEWNEIEGTEGTIIAKFYKQNYTVQPTSFNANFSEGDAYHLVIEGTGKMGDLADVVWNKLISEYVKDGSGNPIIAYVTEVYICDSIENIGISCLEMGVSINKLVIGNTISDIGDAAFALCSSLKSVTLPSNIKNIGNSVFAVCKSLESITIPSNVVSIGDYAFNTCESLKNIIIPDSVTSIGEGTFGGSGLVSIIIPNSVISIGKGAFFGAGSLESIVMPNTITSIEENLFNECRNLKSVTIPKSVVNIGKDIFSLSGVEDVVYEGTKEEWNEIAKDTEWNGSILHTIKIVCTDGEITIEQ